MTAAELDRLAEELGLDVVGAAPASAYEETERHIRERRERGLFADMRFTMAQPEVSCHPETLLPEPARWSPPRTATTCRSRRSSPARAGLPRYTWYDGYAVFASGWMTLGRRLGVTTACSSTRTSTSTARAPSAPGSGSTARTRC